MNMLRKILTLVTTPGMQLAYAKWITSRLFTDTGPFVRCTPGSHISGWINFSEYWAFHAGLPRAEKRVCEKCLQEASRQPTIAIDVGANIGLFTVALRDIGYDQVHSFEPVPTTFKRLESNVARNSFTEKITLNRMAVGSEEGTVKFQVFEHGPAVNRIVKPGTESITSTISVSVTTLDQYCQDRGITHIDFLKIDVEGMEPLVLQGAKKLLAERRVAKILLEICPSNLESVGHDVLELYQNIIGMGYTPYLLLETGEQGTELTLGDLQKISLANIVLIPKSRRA